VYRGHQKAEKNFGIYSLYVMYYPQLVAGPIERPQNLLHQFHDVHIFNANKFIDGLKLMVWGFFLKLVIADRTAIYVDSVYNNVPYHDGLTFIAATVLFAFQIYCDFAGYSLIAIGASCTMGIDLMQNFNRPYFAHSIQEFWRRWHISLSTWFRDYLYIPLGGNRVSKHRWLFNLFITFVISGLWHGANWTFIMWGALHGIYLIIDVLLDINRKRNFFNILLTFVLVNFAWIFFRANTISDAFTIIADIFMKPGKLFIPDNADVAVPIYAVIAISMLIIVEFKKEFFDSLFSISRNKFEIVRMSYYSLLIFIILYLGVFNGGQFIYFQF
jgi:alginate O-acetyltransferase complex protein AlgI